MAFESEGMEHGDSYMNRSMRELDGAAEITARFDVTDGRLAAELRDAVTGDVVVRGDMEIAVRLLDRVPHKVFLRTVTEFTADDQGSRVGLRDESGRFNSLLQVVREAGRLRFSASVSSPEPVWMLEWRCEGWRLDELIVPALGGQVVTDEMPIDRSLAYKYPFWWNAQFALGILAPGAGVAIRTEDVEPQMKVLRIGRDGERAQDFVIGLAFEADAPVESRFLGAEWFVEPFTGSWREGVAIHRKWMEPAFDLVERERHAHRPEWVEDIDLILEFWGMRADRGRPAHTFDDMITRIESFADRHTPETTLVYLPGFAEDGIDTNAPSYDPARQCGGSVGFGRLIDRAHALGYRVMIHTNVLAMTFNHPRFSEFENKQVTDPFGRRQGWGMDIDGDWLAEPFFAYVNPAYGAWSDLIIETLGRLIDDYALDAVFIDQTLLAFNDSRGPNFMTGMREHIERLQQAFPGTLFAGEGLHEHVLSALPVAQIHGLDSIADVHGMEGTADWRRVHPVSVELFSPYTNFLPHLLTRHPSSPSFARQEEAYSQLGIPPALVFYDRRQSGEGPEIEALLARARARRPGRLAHSA
jgi:hypothetical protein